MKKLGYLALVATGLMSANVMADTATGTLTVKANVVKSCTVNTPASGSASNAVIDFGTITSLTGNVDADTTTSGGAKISVLCTNNTPWTLALDAGKNASGTQRRMTGGTPAEFLPYNLFKDSARTAAIVSGAATYAGTGNGTPQTNDVYGRIPAGTALPSAGAYLDTVTLTVTY